MKTCERSTQRLGASLVAFCAVFGSHAVAHAADCSAEDRANARVLFNEGLDLRKAGDLNSALRKLEAADALCSTPKTRCESGRQLVSVGRLVSGHAVLLSVANAHVDPREESKYEAVRRDAAMLAEEVAPKIAELRIQIEPSSPDRAQSVTIQGRDIPEAAWTEPRRLDPGEYDVVVRSALGATASTHIVLGEGEHRTVTLRLPATPKKARPTGLTQDAPPPSPRATLESPPTNAGGQRVWAVVTGSAGGAALVAGSVFAVMARTTYDASKPFCTGPGNLCFERGVELRDDALGKASVATGFAIAGALALVGGVVLWLTAPQPTRVPSKVRHGGLRTDGVGGRAFLLGEF